MAEYTRIEEIDSIFKQIDWGHQALPQCQASYMLMGDCDKPGEFDTPTLDGPWGDLCIDHVKQAAKAHSSVGFHRIPKGEGS